MPNDANGKYGQGADAVTDDDSLRAGYRQLGYHESLLTGRYRLSDADLAWIKTGDAIKENACALPDAVTFAAIFDATVLKPKRGVETDNEKATRSPLSNDDWLALFAAVFKRTPTGNSDAAWDQLVKCLWRHRNPR